MRVLETYFCFDKIAQHKEVYFMKYNELDLNVKYILDSRSHWPENFNGIYGLFCKDNSKWYIGMTRQIDGFMGRWENHRTLLRNGNHDNKYLQNTYNKYGSGAFSFKVLEIMDMNDVEMGKREWIWIEKLQAMHYQNGFNLDERDRYKSRKIIDRNAFIDKRKTFQLINPNGEIITATGINNFALLNNMKNSCLCNLLNGKLRSYKGYKSINKEFHKKIIIYQLISPDGQLVTFNTIRGFCRDNNLWFSGIHSLLRGELKKSQGWTKPPTSQDFSTKN